jgi:hypothetical protein
VLPEGQFERRAADPQDGNVGSRGVEDQLPLLLNGSGIRDAKGIGRTSQLKKIRDKEEIIPDLVDRDREKSLFSLEVPEGEHKKGLNRGFSKGLYQGEVWWTEGEVAHSFLISKGQSVVQCCSLWSIEHL